MLTQAECCSTVMLNMDTIQNIQNGFSVGLQSAVATWNRQLGIASNGNMTTIGSIKAVGNMSGRTGSFTGTEKTTPPPAVGEYLGMDTAAGGINIYSTTVQYIDFLMPYSGYKGRISDNSNDSILIW